MSDVIMVPDNNNRGNNGNMDAAMLYSMMNNNGGFGNGNWLWVIFLFFLEPFMRGGWGNGMFGGANGGGFTNNLIENTAGREMLMQAINRNGDAIGNLANMFGTSVDFVKQAICGVEKTITQLSGTVGLTGQQTINAIQQGNMQIQSQLASCCCDIRESVTKSNYDNQIATLQQTQVLGSDINSVRAALTQGFCDTAYAFRDQTCQLNGAIKDSTQVLKDSGVANTQAILNKLDAMERNGLMDKIDSLREQNSLLRTNSNIREQNWATQQMIGSAVAPIAAQLAEIKCAQPNTVTIPYYPFSVTPNCGCNNNNYGYNNNGNGCGCQNQFWY